MYFYPSGCIPSDEQVRVCPSMKSRRGWIWAKQPFSHGHWMVDVSLRVTGRLKTGADGMVRPLCVCVCVCMCVYNTCWPVVHNVLDTPVDDLL